MGTDVRFTTSNGDILAIPAQAMTTAAMGDIERPIDAAKFIGNSQAFFFFTVDKKWLFVKTTKKKVVYGKRQPSHEAGVSS